MSTETPTLFTAFKFDEREEYVAKILPPLTYQHVQTELAIAAQEKVLLAYDPELPEKFKLENEFIRGKIAALSFLLKVSDDLREEMEAKVREELIEAQARAQFQQQQQS